MDEVKGSSKGPITFDVVDFKLDIRGYPELLASLISTGVSSHTWKVELDSNRFQ